jgi:hypothetical protein
MKPIRMKNMMPTRNISSQTVGSRSGSTLLVVIALLAILSLLGVVFYTFASQEYNSSGYFAEAAINEADPGIQSDVLFNFALEQLIKGPNRQYYNSALWGNRADLLHNMFGDDIHPYSGEGIYVALDGSGAPLIQNYDGSSGDQSLLDFNLSPSAQGSILSTTDLASMPGPDVDYTYPDINNLFLAHNSYVRDGSNETNPNPGSPPVTSPVHMAHVIIPSFHRPQYLRDPTTGDLISNWYSDPRMSARVLRPHPDHQYYSPSGNQIGSRFSTSAVDPFPFAPTNISGGTSQNGEMGIWSGSFGLDTGFPQSEQFVYEFDVDNDGDGIREGIWMDLDFPPIENPATPGEYVIPLFSFTVYDLDGLLNLNTAGNMRLPGDDVTRGNEIDLNSVVSGASFGGNLSGSRNQFYLLSRSNMGLSSPGEVNPQWAMNATVPVSVSPSLDQHQRFFGKYPGSWMELSNMEYFFLNFGRAEFDTLPSSATVGTKTEVLDLYAGRWGESGLLYDNLRETDGDDIYLQRRDEDGNLIASFPRAGITGTDDNEDRFEGTYLSGSLRADSNQRAGAQSFEHPLAYNGSGRVTQTGANYRSRLLVKPLSASPSIWPAYNGVETADPVGHPGSHGTTYSPHVTQAIRYPYALFSPARNSAIASRTVLLDDSDEITVDLDQVNRKYDEPFGLDEMAYLSLSNTDISNNGIISRLKSLIPYNFATSSRSENIRKNFTTASWDRKQFARTQNTGSSFPPPFMAAGAFRTELEALFNVSEGDRTSALRQFRLNLNELLVLEGTGTGRTLSTRPLTPHPGEDKNGNGSLDYSEDLNGNNAVDTLGSGIINTGWDKNTTPTYPPSSVAAQEFWARYDRQRMARDIYTLLYAINTDENSSTAPSYTDEQKREMAQFAVNVVDALDPDDVMSRFEYDTNPSDGWNLDDNPYTSTGESQRKVVWGVEAHQLTLSEFILIDCQDQDDDRTVTQFPDDKVNGADRSRYFTAIELRNNSPYPVHFGSRGKWMIGLEVNGTMMTYAVPKNKTVTAGGLFTLLSTNTSDTLEAAGGDPYSEFRVDLNANGDFTDSGERIIPSANINTNDKIDIVKDQAASGNLVTVFDDSFTNITGTAGSFLDSAESTLATPGVNVKIKLFRKAHLGRDTYLTTGLPVPDLDNPWVLVDEMSVSKGSFNLGSDTVPVLEGQLTSSGMRSRERSEPLNKQTGEQPYTDPMATRNPNIQNTLGELNSRAQDAGASFTFTLWQPHFNRDFASVVDLFSIPIVGPTQEIVAPQTPPPLSVTGPNGSNLDGSSNATTTTHRLITYALADSNGRQAEGGTNGVQTAGIQKFLDPDGPNNSTNTTDDNWWYRLFEFVEIPSRIHREGKTNPYSDPRTPGKLNLNTIRHPSVLAALLDDTDLILLNRYTDSLRYYHRAPLLHDTVDDVNRDWWEQFILARDKTALNATNGNFVPNPTAPLGGSSVYPVPGLPGSKPFRSFDFAGGASAKRTQNNLFRGLPADLGTNPNDPRQLFEVATLNEHTDGVDGAGTVDFHTRNRILAKIAGNTTNRSNVFVVFMSVAYFKATSNDFDDPEQNVRIGARVSPIDPVRDVNQPDYRGFFVIDRTRAEEAYEPSTSNFDHWKRLIRYRLTLQE